MASISQAYQETSCIPAMSRKSYRLEAWTPVSMVATLILLQCQSKFLTFSWARQVRSMSRTCRWKYCLPDEGNRDRPSCVALTCRPNQAWTVEKLPELFSWRLYWLPNVAPSYRTWHPCWVLYLHCSDQWSGKRQIWALWSWLRRWSASFRILRCHILRPGLSWPVWHAYQTESASSVQHHVTLLCSLVPPPSSTVPYSSFRFYCSRGSQE